MVLLGRHQIACTPSSTVSDLPWSTMHNFLKFAFALVLISAVVAAIAIIALRYIEDGEIFVEDEEDEMA